MTDDVKQREAKGKEARAHTPRSSHAGWKPAKDREDPVAILQGQAESRVPELVPIRYGRMLVSPFTFYRGAAAIMAADLARHPSSGLQVQLCGDAHLSNFGIFASPEREMLFDINDFDETSPGPWEWDVKRLTVSLCVAGRDRNLTNRRSPTSWRGPPRHTEQSMRGFAQMSNLSVWYAKLNAKDIMGVVRAQQLVKGKRLQKMERRLGKARDEGQHARSPQAHRNSRWELALRERTAFDRAVEDLLGEAESGELRERLEGMITDYGNSLAGDHRALLEQLQLPEHRAQGRGRGQRRHARVGDAVHGP